MWPSSIYDSARQNRSPACLPIGTFNRTILSVLDLVGHLLLLNGLDHLFGGDLVPGVGVEHAEPLRIYHADVARNLAALYLPLHAEVGQGEVGGEHDRGVLARRADLVEPGLHRIGHLRIGVHFLDRDHDRQ